MSAFLREYGVATVAATHIRIPIVKAGSIDFAVSGDWTPATGDVKVTKNGGTEADIGTLPTYVNGLWQFVFTVAELQAKNITVKVVDSATKAVEDQAFIIETYGHASAMHQFNFNSEPRRFASVVAGTLTTTAFSTDLTEVTSNHYKGRRVLFLSGNLAEQATDITGYNGTTKVLTVSTMTEAPAANDDFVIL